MDSMPEVLPPVEWLVWIEAQPGYQAGEPSWQGLHQWMSALQKRGSFSVSRDEVRKTLEGREEQDGPQGEQALQADPALPPPVDSGGEDPGELPPDDGWTIARKLVVGMAIVVGVLVAIPVAGAGLLALFLVANLLLFGGQCG